MGSMTGSDQIRRDFIDAMGRLGQGEGLPPIAGRIFGLLVFDGGRHSFSALAEKLEVSRASISTSARLLEEAGLITRLREGEQRGDYFELAERPYVGLLSRALVRAEDNLHMLEQTRAALPEGAEDTRARLDEFAAFYAQMKEMSAQVMARLDGASQ